MLAALQKLISLLVSDPLTADKVALQLGTVVEDLGASLAVTPANPLFRDAIVARGIDLTTREPSNVPALVRLTLVDPPPLETLGTVFGSYREVPPEDRGQLPKVIFYIQPPEGPCLIALIAEVRDGRAVTITLRRDILP